MSIQTWHPCLASRSPSSAQPFLSVCRSLSVGAGADIPEGGSLYYPKNSRAYVLGPNDPRPLAGLSVAIIGASGNIGRSIAMSLTAQRQKLAGLGPFTIKFCGRRQGSSFTTLIGLCSELRDTYDEFCPHLEVYPDLEAVQADIIVMVAGATLSHTYKNHAALARANLDLFEEHANVMVKKNPKSMVVVGTNPVEVGVDAFVAAGFHPDRVIGTGALCDTLRFRREVASEVGVPRQYVTGLVLGMHGLAMVQCWSTVRLAAVCSAEAEEKLERLKEEGLGRMPVDVEETRKLAIKVRDMTEANDAFHANQIVRAQPPEIRAALRRYVSNFAGPSYPRFFIGQVVADTVIDLLNGRELFTAAQVHVTTNFLGLKDHAIGAPVVLSGKGIRLNPVPLARVEEQAIRESGKQIQEMAAAVRAIKSLREATRMKRRGSF